jgi:Cu+-exporting ATPase
MEDMELKIKGMKCSHCTQTLHKALSEIQGVAKATVNLRSKTAQIEFDPGQTGYPRFETVIRDAGFNVEPLN